MTLKMPETTVAVPCASFCLRPFSCPCHPCLSDKACFGLSANMVNVEFGIMKILALRGQAPTKGRFDVGAMHLNSRLTVD